MDPNTELSSEDDSDGDGEETYVAPTNKRPLLWKVAERSEPSSLPQFQVMPDDADERASWNPATHFEMYIDNEVYERMALAMNTKHVAETGRSLNTSAEELKMFFGMSIAMSGLGYPQIRMFWMKNTRVPIIANSMTRDRFFQLRSRLKVVKDLLVTPKDKEDDRLWRIRPLTEKVLEGCRKLPREEFLSIDEQMIPFTGKTQLKQFVPRKPNPIGLKNFVLAAPDGLILDFEIYQGKKTLLLPGCSGIGESAVLRLSQSLSPGTKLFFDRYFTSSSLLDRLVEKGIGATGPIMNNRLPKGIKLSSDAQLKAVGRGTSEMCIRSDDRQIVVRWYDNKAVTLLSSQHGTQPLDSCRRWSAKEKKYIEVPRPHIVQVYNAYMGGVDMADRMISYYRLRARVKKWTVRCIFHLFDIALSNSWIQYTRHMKAMQKKPTDILKFLDFRSEVGHMLIAQAEQASTEEEEENWSPPMKRKPLRPMTAMRNSMKHLPRLADIPNGARCRLEGCQKKTKFFCIKCDLFFCITKDRRCFERAHMRK
ncbi:piggyBac transposable element-derived protein 3-like [Dermacentor albipictus]|uniref:piggyBac transposable element-derived protein 3-like n=1 Tax=Dermacentor albipictus TaxID=60249 RepID=UPI0038FC88DF